MLGLVSVKFATTFFVLMIAASSLRLYAGGSYLVDQEPLDLDPGLARYGLEVTSPWRLASGAVTPVAAADFQNNLYF